MKMTFAVLLYLLQRQGCHLHTAAGADNEEKVCQNDISHTSQKLDEGIVHVKFHAFKCVLNCDSKNFSESILCNILWTNPKQLSDKIQNLQDLILLQQSLQGPECIQRQLPVQESFHILCNTELFQHHQLEVIFHRNVNNNTVGRTLISYSR